MNADKTIYIIGAGAIGKALAVFLQQTNQQVIIVRGSIDNESGYSETITVEHVSRSETITATVDVITPSELKVPGILVFTNKSFGNTRLAELLHARCNHWPVVILQNGLEVEQPFIDQGFTQILRAVIFASSQPMVENRLRFKPVEPSPIGIITGNPATQELVVRELSSPYFEFRSVPDISPLVWTKTIVNCVFNSVCPLLETDNGIFYRDEKALGIALGVIRECVAIAQQAGIAVTFDAVANKLLQISKSGEGQLISTYQDILNKRETEIDSFNFAIVRLATGLNSETTVIQTKLLGELVKLKAGLARSK